MNGRVSSACEQDGQWDVAVQLYERMLKQRVTPTVVTFSALVTVCEKGGAWQAAVRAFEAMQEAGVTPNHITWGALMSALQKGGQFKKVTSTSTPTMLVWCAPVFCALLSTRTRNHFCFRLVKLGTESALTLRVSRRALFTPYLN
jgi:pentatricopeptide repeat protein